MNEDEIRDHLHALGDEPIDDVTRTAHLRRMAAAGEASAPRRSFVWAGIGAAAIVGFLAGSTGLAMADALPDPAQAVAHDVLRAVQVDLPEGKEGKRGQCVSEAAKIKDKDAKRAAKEACPKGGGGPDDESGDDQGAPADEQSPTNKPGGPPAADDPCRGRPPWAGPMSKEQRAAAKEANSRENCPKNDEEADEEADEHNGDDESDDADDAASTESTTTTSTTAVAEPNSAEASSTGD